MRANKIRLDNKDSKAHLEMYKAFTNTLSGKYRRLTWINSLHRQLDNYCRTQSSMSSGYYDQIKYFDACNKQVINLD